MNTIISMGREMKKVALPICFLFFSTSLFAQGYLDICVTEDEEPQGFYSYSTDPQDLEDLDPVVFNVYYWRVDDPFGVPNTVHVTEQSALESIQYLNIAFNSMGVYFKYRGLGTITSPSDLDHQIWDYDEEVCVCLPDEIPINDCEDPEIDPDGFANMSRCQITLFNSFVNQNGYKEPDAINIYVAGLTDFGGVRTNGRNVITHPWGIAGPTGVHEMGHLLGLDHTFQGWIRRLPDGTVDENYENCEHVTRNPSDPAYNADSKGDYINDTAAMPSFRREYCYLENLPLSQCSEGGPHYFEYYDINNCVYTGAETDDRGDCQGTLYVINPTQSRNYMSYAISACLDNFTIGQKIRMRETINNSSVLQSKTTTLAALYEPYKGEYYVAGPSGGGPVQNPPLFQPGFNYRFVECECDPSCAEPSPYGDTSFSYTNNSVLTIFDDETDFSTITHPNHTAIQIDLVYDLPDSYGQNIRRCYDNWNRAAKDGSLTRFNDGVFNTNITVTPQDSTQINNPNFVNELNPGLYKVDKNYDDGTTKETVVLKEQNE